MARKREHSVEPYSPSDSTIGLDVSLTQAQAHPSSYMNRWVAAADGSVIPRANASTEKAPAIRTEKNSDGSMSVYIPELAFGTAGYGYAQGGIDSFQFSQTNAPPESNIWGDAEYFGMWDSVLDQRDGRYDMRRAVRWWIRDPVVYACTKLLCQLSNARVNFKSEDDDAKTLVEKWFKQAMPHSFRSAFFLEWFRTGYIPVLKTLVNYEPRNFKPNKIPQPGLGGNIDHFTYASEVPAEQATAAEIKESLVQAKTSQIMNENLLAAEEYEKASAAYQQANDMFKQGLCSAARRDYYMNDMSAKQYKWLKGQVPGSYTILSPFLVDLKGPQSMQWLREPYLQISGDLITAITSPTPLQRMMVDKIPVEITQQIKEGATYVWLSPNIFTLVCRDRQPYERYPVPMMRHCFDALEMKYDIQAMDKATVRGVKSRILLVKIGNDTYPVTDPQQIARVAGVFNSVGRTGTFFWSHAIEMEWIEPDLSSFSNPDKFKHYNDEIRSAYGVAPILTGTAESGGSIGNHIMNFKGVEQEVIAAQSAFKELLDKEVRMLRTSLKISAEVEIDFERLNLKDEIGFWQVINQAVLNGVLDHETALETLGFHFPQIKNRMETMQGLKKKGLFVPQPSANNLGPDGTMKPTGSKGPGGRQNLTKKANKNKNKTNKSQPKKAKASMRAVGDDVVVLVEGTELDAEQRKDIAELYQTDQKWVMTTAEFVEKYPKVDMNPDWPELNALETVSATMAAANIVKDTEKRFEKQCSEFKEGSTDKRAYLSAQKKSEFETVARIEANFKHLKERTNVETLPPGWDKHYDNIKASLLEQFEGLPPEQLDAQAFAMTTLRFKKRQAL